jgi:hypothetical protein
MNRSFQIYRWLGRALVDGWLQPEVLAILSALDSAQRAKGVSGAVAEIGVHHGKLFIGLNLLRRKDERAVAIDVFGAQELNIDFSGKGYLPAFRRNVQRWSSLTGVAIHEGDSTQLHANELRELAHADIRLFSVDGGHTESTVRSDMNLAEGALAPGGIVIADDIFNETWPSVATGTFQYLTQGGKLVPFAIGFNKVFFSSPEYADYYQSVLRSTFELGHLVLLKTGQFSDHEVVIIKRFPWQPREIIRQHRQLIGRSRTVRNVYYGVRRWRSGRT